MLLKDIVSNNTIYQIRSSTGGNLDSQPMLSEKEKFSKSLKFKINPRN